MVIEFLIYDHLVRRAAIRKELRGFSGRAMFLRHSVVNAPLIPLIHSKKMENTEKICTRQVIPDIKSRRVKTNLFMNH